MDTTADMIAHLLLTRAEEALRLAMEQVGTWEREVERRRRHLDDRRLLERRF